MGLLPLQRAVLQDPSKASGLAKLITCAQALWFYSQCIARLRQDGNIAARAEHFCSLHQRLLHLRVLVARALRRCDTRLYRVDRAALGFSDVSHLPMEQEHG